MFLVILGYYEVLNTNYNSTTPLKASSSISCNSAENTTSSKCVPKKACKPIFFNEAGRVTFFNPVSRKASELISCRAVLDRSTSVKATQSSNACPPISFKEAGNATEANFWLPEKA